MKEIQVKSLAKMEAEKVNRGEGNVFAVKQITDSAAMQKCAAAFVEVEPGNTAYGYHWHETVEEIFYIISGEGKVRTLKGDVVVKPGDVVCFPTGEGGAHAIRNDSANTKLVYLDFGTRGECEIAHLIDAKKMLVIGQTGMNICDEAK
jgi:uncharacterized cupin superfamily protein